MGGDKKNGRDKGEREEQETVQKGGTMVTREKW